MGYILCKTVWYCLNRLETNSLILNKEFLKKLPKCLVEW
jgi:hypothetical protein